MLGPADMPGLPPECYRVLVLGQQAVAKGRQDTSALNKVQVRVGGRACRCCLAGCPRQECSGCTRAVSLLQLAARRATQPTVQVALCVVRLPQHGSDVLLTLNTPIYISEKSAAAEHAGAWLRDGRRT